MSAATMAGANIAAAQAAQNAAASALVLQIGILRFFRAKGAITEDKAIFVQNLDWLEMGMNLAGGVLVPVNSTQKLFDFYGVKRTSDGKYWLDVDLYEKNVIAGQEKNKRLATIMLIPLGILLAIAIGLMIWSFAMASKY